MEKRKGFKIGISNLSKDRGIALVIALVILLVLTLIGISSITTTTFETRISSDERMSAESFYAAEAGIGVGLNHLPETNPIGRTKLGENSYYWGQIEARGPFLSEGYGSTWQFERFQVNAMGESFGVMNEIEVQVRYGPFPGGTSYNN